MMRLWGSTSTTSTIRPWCWATPRILADITTDGIYYTANFEAGGQGYYANGGKIIPITWGADDAESPFWFKTVDGEPLELGVGNTYMAIAPVDSPVSYQ